MSAYFVTSKIIMFMACLIASSVNIVTILQCFKCKTFSIKLCLCLYTPVDSDAWRQRRNRQVGKTEKLQKRPQTLSASNNTDQRLATFKWSTLYLFNCLTCLLLRCLLASPSTGPITEDRLLWHAVYNHHICKLSARQMQTNGRACVCKFMNVSTWNHTQRPGSQKVINSSWMSGGSNQLNCSYWMIITICCYFVRVRWYRLLRFFASGTKLKR